MKKKVRSEMGTCIVGLGKIIHMGTKAVHFLQDQILQQPKKKKKNERNSNKHSRQS